MKASDEKVGRRIAVAYIYDREVPIARVARELCLPLHQLDTFTGWKVGQSYYFVIYQFWKLR